MTVKTNEKEVKEKTLETEKMAQVGMHFGQNVSRRHPGMIPYIEGVKGSVHIINLHKTKEKLDECLEYLKKMKEEEKTVLFISTRPETQKMIKEVATECNMPYVVSRFLGGMLTNFKTIKKRIDYYNNLLKQNESGELERKYTKQERTRIFKEMEGLEKKFEGVKNMERLPDIVFVVDMKKDDLVVKEAKICNISIVGIANTDSNPLQANYFIPANNNSIHSVKYILDKVKTSLNTKTVKKSSSKEE